MRTTTSCFAALGMTALLAVPAAAQSTEKKGIESLQLGEQIYGPKIDLESLKGRSPRRLNGSAS